MNPPIYSCGNCSECGGRWHLTEYCPYKEKDKELIQITADGDARYAIKWVVGIVLMIVAVFCFARAYEIKNLTKDKPWTIYQSSKSDYFKYTDEKGRLSADSYPSREKAEWALKFEINLYEVKHAESVWKEVP